MSLFLPPALNQLARNPSAARTAIGAQPASQSNGLLVGNGQQTIGRSLIPGFGITISNPDGIGGDVVIEARPGVVLLTSRTGVDLASTSDQLMEVTEYPKYIITQILVTNASATPSAAAGGFYTVAGKTGYTLVGATQSYSALTDSSVVLACTLGTQRVLTGPDIYLSLTTANGAACTVDVYVFGLWLAA